MKRPAALLAAAALALSLAATDPATAYDRPTGPCTDAKYRVTREMGYEKRTTRGRWVVRCAFNAIAPSHLERALDVAYRESRFDPFAVNHNGGPADCLGLFQHMRRYWGDRVTAYLHAREFPNTWPGVSAFRARANAIVAARVVRRHGWGAWS